MKADITNYEVVIPTNEEAACLGAAIIGAVSTGIFNNFNEAIENCVSMRKAFCPSKGKNIRIQTPIIQETLQSITASL